MHLRVLVLTMLSSILFLAGDVSAAAPKAGGKISLVKRFDFNGDGKINNMERAAARMTIAQQREQRAMRRNDKFVR